MSVDLIFPIGFILLLIFCTFLSWLLLELFMRPLKMKGIIILDTAREDEKYLRSTIPELQRNYDKWHRLVDQTARQEWNSGKIRPVDPIRAFFYRFIAPGLWKRKLKKCEKCRDDYDMLLKLHLRHEEESFAIHS